MPRFLGGLPLSQTISPPWHSIGSKGAPRESFRRARFLIAAAFFVALNSRAGAPQSGVPVLVEKAMQGCFSSAVRFTGLAVPRAETIVNLDVTGYQISALLVAEGDSVTAGQVLARLSPLSGGPEEGPSAATGGAQQAGNAALRAPAAGVIRRVKTVIL